MDCLSERGTPDSDVPLTVSPADTSLKDCEIDPEIDVEAEEDEDDEKKPTKKRKSWGQELPVPKTNLPPRFVSTLPVHLSRIHCPLILWSRC